MTNLSRLRERRDPVCPGLSIGHFEKDGGTITAVVEDARGQRVALSCLHVFQRKRREAGAKVVQPGRRDSDHARITELGHVIDGFLDIDGDASICSIETRSQQAALAIWGIAPASIGRVQDGDFVAKFGRTTGKTIGRVADADEKKLIHYGGKLRDKRVSGFVIVPDPQYPAPRGQLSLAGDSGAPYFKVINGQVTPELVGMHTAGPSARESEEWAFASHIDAAFERLNLHLLTGLAG